MVTTPRLSGVGIHLVGTDDLGQSVNLFVTTDDNGVYSFTGLRAGTYSITEDQPSGYADGADYAGTVNGVTNGVANGTLGADEIDNIQLGTGQSGVNYIFTEQFIE